MLKNNKKTTIISQEALVKLGKKHLKFRPC